MVAILDTKQTLKEALKEFAIDKPGDIPWIVRLLENPASPVALPGKISLLGHDCLHLLLDRYLSSSDEAFVIGFSMGNHRKTKSWHIKIFKFFSRYLYPDPYKFTPQDFYSFDLGFEYGRSLNPKIQTIYQTKYSYFDIEFLRNLFEIKTEYLLELKLKEKAYRSQYLADLTDRKKKLVKLLNPDVLKISSSIFALGGGLILALNKPWSGYGFIFLACSSSQMLLASILGADKIMIGYSAILFTCVDLLGVYCWLFAK